MPRFLLPSQSGRHRFACLALYRALVRQCGRTPFPRDQQNSLRAIIAQEFQKKKDWQSIPLLRVAFQAGYEANDVLASSARGSVEGTSRILKLLHELGPSLIERPSLSVTKSPDHTRPNGNKSKFHPPAPYPGASPVLSRPYKQISGRRHIPVLVNANGFPILRFKKPQSPFLSRILRQKITQRHRRVERMHALESMMQLANEEDEWDSLLQAQHGISLMPESKWTREILFALMNTREVLKQQYEAIGALSARMLDIVEKEKELAAQEKAERLRSKRLERLARKRARGGQEHSR
ncbi:hypothetical protein L228DRAFT_283474 [Xylona heveae TC161]|uniref:Complex 1 LYR protein domain-containing protein n=1 Tax=Xylona heveae (strain CBS 132557 / TC161) TaxID=1328760 RepID=A0A165GKT3_XYLHT|nr:hypothetical protein L228DRAFT_283474 [Xylona heveae TC161]KZF22313.1 hypothetical protein L228DRAFT_283474 [Xylona heveae TC161]